MRRSRSTASSPAPSSLSPVASTRRKLPSTATRARSPGAATTRPSELLTVAEITVTGAELSADQRTLFGDTVETKTYQLGTLMSEMEGVYTNCRGKLSALKTAMHKVRENKADIERLFGEVEAIKPNLSEAGLVFEPYQKGMDALTAARDAFIAIMNSDPLEASDNSQSVEDGVTAVKAALNRAITLKQSLSTTAAQIDAPPRR